MRHLVHLLAVSAVVALATVARAAPPAAKPISDRELGLSRTSVFDVPSPPAWKPEASAPGEKPLPPRPYAVAPPVIPHTIAEYLPITPTRNTCVECHLVDRARMKVEPTRPPASHFVDLRRAPGTKGDKVAGALWYCQACHVPRSDAPPAVGNTFKP